MHSRGRRAFVTTLLVLTSLLVGCLGSDTTADETGEAPPALHVPSTSAGQPFALFLCKDGYHVAGEVTQGMDRCNHRVTRPLLDPGLFDWQTQHGPANEVSIAVNPTDPLHAAGGGKDYTVSYISDHARCGEYTVWMGTYWTTDGGLTWGNDLMPGFPGDERESPLSGNWCNTDPVLVWDDDGTLWYSGLNYDGARKDSSVATNPETGHDVYSGSQLYFAKSTDGGATYGDITFSSFGDDGAIFNDKQWFAAQPGGDHMIATWSQFFALTTDAIVYTESWDGGQTWSHEKPLRPGGNVGGLGVTQGVALPAAGQFSMPQYLPGAAANDGQDDLAVIWWNGTHVLYAQGLMAQGATEFGPVISTFPVNSLKSDEGRDGTGPTEFRLSTYPVLAVDTSGGPCDGRRYVVWADQPGEVNTDTQVLLRTSDDGLTWSDPVTVNDDDAGDQFMPWIDVDPTGGVHVAWYDRRGDPDNRLMDVYYAYSDACGDSFYPNVRVSETHFDGDEAHHQNGRPFIGDYIGLDTTEHSAHVLWADTRHTGELGRATGSDVYSATILRDLDARSAFDAAFEGAGATD